MQNDKRTTRELAIEFNNGDLQRDAEKHLRADEIHIVKSEAENDGEDIYYLDINDDGYFYYNESDRDFDYARAKSLFSKLSENPEQPIKEQSSNRGEGDILEYALSYIKKIDKETGTMWTEDDKTIASHFIEFSKTLAPELAKENQQLRESNTRLKERIEVLNQMERKFYMDICRAYNAGKQNALEMVAEGKRNGESLESFKSSHEYFIGEFPTFKTNVP